MASKNPVVLLASVLLLASFGLPAASIDSSNTTSEVVPHAHMGRELQQTGIETAAAVTGIVASAVTIAGAVFGGASFDGTPIKSAAAEVRNPGLDNDCIRPQVGQCLDGYRGREKATKACSSVALARSGKIGYTLATKDCSNTKGAQKFKQKSAGQRWQYGIEEIGIPRIASDKQCVAAYYEGSDDVYEERFRGFGNAVCGVPCSDDNQIDNLFDGWDIDPAECDDKGDDEKTKNVCQLCDEFSEERSCPCPRGRCGCSVNCVCSSETGEGLFKIRGNRDPKRGKQCMRYEGPGKEVSMVRCDDTDVNQLWFMPNVGPDCLKNGQCSRLQ